MTLLAALAVGAATYFSAYRGDCADAVKFADTHRPHIETLVTYMPRSRALMAMCVVAPELSRYSAVLNYGEVYSLKVLYVQGNASDFSVGPCQMKPTFAEAIERKVGADATLKKRYGKLLITVGTAREQRHTRVNRIDNLQWQMLYLAAFMDIAEMRLASESVSGDVDKLRLLATMYNCGVDKPMAEIRRQMQVKRFPRLGPRAFNYADIAAEFYAAPAYCPYLR